MAKIKTFQAPEKEAPFLRQNLQRIDIPRDAFGEGTGRAFESLGAAGESASTQLGNAVFRMQQRRNITQASTAAKDVPLTALEDLNVMKGEAMANPNLLPGFAESYVNDFDKKAKILRDGLTTEGARLQFDAKILSTRTTMAKNAITWARAQEIVVGRNNLNSEVQNEITVAGGDIGNLDAHRLKIVDLINEAEASGFLVSGKKKLDSSVVIRDALRDMDIEVVQSLIQNNPAILQQMIDDNQLPGLTEKDINKTEKDIINSMKHIDERAIFSEIQETLALYPDLNDKFNSGTLTYQTVDNLETDGRISEVAARVWKSELIAPERKTEEQLIEEGIEKGVQKARIKAAVEAGVQEVTGIVKPPKLSDPVKDAKHAELAEFFTEDLQEIILSQNINSIDKLNSILEFADKVFQAHEDGAFVGRKKMFGDYMKVLIPSVKEMVDSKYLEGAAAGAPGIPLGIPGVNFGIKVFAKPKNMFADNYLASMRILQETSPFFAGVDANKVEVMSKTLALIKQSQSITDEVQQKEFLRNVPTMAVTELLQELNPNGNFDNLNQTISGVNFQAAPVVNIVGAPQGAVDFLIANPTDDNIKQFNQKFGDGEAERLLR